MIKSIYAIAQVTPRFTPRGDLVKHSIKLFDANGRRVFRCWNALALMRHCNDKGLWDDEFWQELRKYVTSELQLNKDCYFHKESYWMAFEAQKLIYLDGTSNGWEMAFYPFENEFSSAQWILRNDYRFLNDCYI